MYAFLPWILVLGAGLMGLPAQAQVSAEPCHVDGMSRELLCGEVAVPLRADEEAGEEIRLAYTLIQAQPGQRSEDAVLLLAGGPGQGAQDFTALMGSVLERTTRQRDLLLLDLRGTGQSGALNCPDLDLSRQDPQVMIDGLAECRKQLDFDPADYSSHQYVADLERVREAFGYQQWNLLGGSYGTRLAQLYMREHPEVIRSAVLDSVAPLDQVIGARMGADAEGAMQGIFQRCEASPDCQETFPDLRDDFAAMLDRLDEEPVEVSYRHPRSGEIISREVGRETMTALIRGLLYDRSQHRVLPYMIHRAAEGHFELLLSSAAQTEEGIVESMAMGLTANIICSEDIGRHGREAVPAEESASFIGSLQADFWLEVCADWPRYDVPENYDEPLLSDIPTLLVSGELDPVTPPAYGDQLLKTLSNARHVVLPGGAHTEGFLGGHCIGGILNDFIKDAALGRLETFCLDRLSPQPFFTRTTGFAMTPRADVPDEETDND